MRLLKYIIVGTGGWGGQWCREFLPRLTEIGKAIPVAAVDLNPDAHENASKYLKLADNQIYSDTRAAFDDHEADFAVIVVPPAHHEAAIDVALDHNLHILCEKPIADSMAACCRIYRKVKAADRKMAVTMSHRFDRDKQTLQRLIESGEYGPLNYIVSRFTNNCRKYASWGEFRHKIPDPLLIEGTVHHFDIFRALTGANAQTVYAKTWNPPWGEFAGDSTGLITMEMTNGVRCFYEGAKANASTMNGWTGEYFRAECEDGTLELDRRKIRVLRTGFEGAPPSEDVELDERPVWMNSWLAEQFCDWLNGGPAPATELDDNMQCAALLFAAIESAHTDRVVDVQDYLNAAMNGD